MKRVTAVLLGALAHWGATHTAAQTIPMRSLAPASAKTVAPLRSVLGIVRELRGGKLLVNDGGARRLLLFDSTLTTYTALRDSADGNADSYGNIPGMILPYLGDSTLFLDMVSRTLLVMDPVGKVARVMAPPNARDLINLRNPGAGIDAKGALVYRSSSPMRITSPATGATPVVQRPPSDSADILRADLDSRRVDTIGRIKLNVGSIILRNAPSTGVPNARMEMQNIINPVPTVDEWAALSDGSIAMVRGHDYHIDWINKDGTRSSTGKIPFEWRRLDDADKKRLVDSAQSAIWFRDSVLTAEAGGLCTLIQTRAGCSDPPETLVVPPSEIPDYYPPIREGAVRADLDNNLWILPTTTSQSKRGELVYDVISRQGELVERVRLPEGRSIAGFGPRGVVYLMWHDWDRGWFIEKTRVVRDR